MWTAQQYNSSFDFLSTRSLLHLPVCKNILMEFLRPSLREEREGDGSVQWSEQKWIVITRTTLCANVMFAPSGDLTADLWSRDLLVVFAGVSWKSVHDTCPADRAACRWLHYSACVEKCKKDKPCGRAVHSADGFLHVSFLQGRVVKRDYSRWHARSYRCVSSKGFVSVISANVQILMLSTKASRAWDKAKLSWK